MHPDQAYLASTILPLAVAWAERQEDYILRYGQPLDEFQIQIARRVGVAHPEKIRTLAVDNIPVPDDEHLKCMAISSGILGPKTSGLTLGYGVYILHKKCSVRLLSHEFRHVYQYEQAGSLSAFIQIYLHQLNSVGYADAPFEIDARNFEM